MDTAPVWATPHHFTRLPVNGADRATGLQPVVTYVLLTTELAQSNLAQSLDSEPASRIGLEWLASLADRLQSNEQLSRLTAFFQEEVGIAKPGQDSNKAALGLPHATSIPADELQAFSAQELPLIHEFVNFELKPFMGELIRAAGERRRPDPRGVDHQEGDGLAAALRLLDVYGPKLQPLPMHRPGTERTVWGLGFQNLAERISVELFELFASRPRLHHCRFCNRIFVPANRTATKCRADLWSPNGRAPLERCIPQHAVDAHDTSVIAGQHNRERKRRHQQMRREIKLYGEGTKGAQRAKDTYQAWINEHGKQRGPAPRPIAGLKRTK